MNLQDLSGNRFGRLLVQFRGRKQGRKQYWWCLCDCNRLIETRSDALKSGRTNSCGCLASELATERCIALTTTHGLSNSKLHNTWCRMKQRCHNPNNPSFVNYGGRGIEVCPEWRESFEAFAEYMGEPPSLRHSIERIDNDGNYEPGNVRWDTPREQVRNRRCSIPPITWDGQTLTLKDWADLFGIEYLVLYKRIIMYGWTAEKAFTKAVRGRKAGV